MALGILNVSCYNPELDFQSLKIRKGGSGRMRLTRNQVYGNPVSRVQIPAFPPKNQWLVFLLFLENRFFQKFASEISDDVCSCALASACCFAIDYVIPL